MRLSGIWSTSVCGVVAAVLAGCGSAEQMPHPNVSPAAGVVTYNHKPVEGASVLFLSADTKKNAWGFSGETDANGEFEITSTFSPTTQVPGVPPGEYTVVVTKTAPVEKLTLAEMDAQRKEFEEKAQKLAASGGDVSSLQKKATSLVPPKYNSEATSDLKVKVEPDGNTDVELNLAD